MRNIFYIIFLSIIVSFCACDNNNNSGSDPADQDSLSVDTLVHITVLYTNDEHGWLEPNIDFDGAPGLMELWKTREGYDGSDNFLIISGGDMWTGPAISTWFEGESMVEVMNAMEYDVATIGNHEFDYKTEGIIARNEQMSFPLISSNISYKSNGEIPDFTIPYIIKEIEGVKVAIIGLTTVSTPYSAAPNNVADYNFSSYSDALVEYATRAKEEGAEVLILAGHICNYEMESIAALASENGISIIGGGHCHEAFARELNGVVLIESGSNMRAYAKVEFDYNKTKDISQDFEYEIVWNNKHSLDADIQAIVDYWVDQTEAELSEVIGYASENISRSSVEMANLVCDSWFYTFPDADISFTNAGGIRQDIPQGEITLETIVGVLPFENMIYKLEFTGDQVMRSAENFLVGGMTTINNFELLDGTAIDVDETYTVLTTDYLYSLTENYFSEYDDTPEIMSVNYRQPLIDWIKSLNTSSTNPLNNYLDSEPRQ